MTHGHPLPSRAVRYALVVVALLIPLAAEAQQVLIEATLTSAPADARFTVTGGTFSVLGWQATSGDDWMIVDVGEGVNEGVAEVNLTNFNPSLSTGPNPENYSPIFSMFEEAGIAHGDSMTTEAFEMMAFSGDEPDRTYKIKFAIWGPCKEVAGYVNSGGQDTIFDWKLGNTYHIKVSWDATQQTLEIADMGSGWPQSSGSVTKAWTCAVEPNLRYLYLNHDHSAYDLIAGTIYSNLKVTKLGDPCANHCGNGTQDCGETGPDCGGACSPCVEPDGGVQVDAGVDGGPADASAVADTGTVADGGALDTGMPQEDVGQDAGTVADAGGESDAGLADATGGDADSSSSGCSCTLVGL